MRQDDDPAYDSYSGSDYDPDYADDAYLPAHGDEFYDEAPRRRLRPWLLAGAAVIAVVVVSASALFAYRAVFGVTNTGAPPVTIRPEAGPTKLVPGSSTKAADSGSNKQIYDRVGGEPSQASERMVSREERPLDASTPTRMPGGTVAAVTPAMQPPQAAPVSTSPATASTEPRRVRTVTVRADGSVVGDQNRPAAAPATAQRAGAPAASGPLALSNSPGSSGAAVPPARPSQGDNPWASVTNQPAPTTQAALPSQAGANPAPIVAVNTPAPAGSYVVQVAAQKTEADAASTWQQLQQKYPAVLGGQQAAIRRVDLGERGVFYRAQVGPFGSRSQASEVCQSLKAAGGECVIQRN
jgi:cell division septation protein DedD